jgi:hypothetical protein
MQSSTQDYQAVELEPELMREKPKKTMFDGLNMK